LTWQVQNGVSSALCNLYFKKEKSACSQVLLRTTEPLPPSTLPVPGILPLEIPSPTVHTIVAYVYIRECVSKLGYIHYSGTPHSITQREETSSGGLQETLFTEKQSRFRALGVRSWGGEGKVWLKW
jgi:hypothetical protein